MRFATLLAVAILVLLPGCGSPESTSTSTTPSTETTEAPTAEPSGEAAQAPAASPCDADMSKFCGGVQPGEGRIAACLREHKDEISEACLKSGAIGSP
jgi:hypothetical protein